ncbi:MAG: thiamine-phosphate kinase [Dehalococcoidia bacterium]|nr:thiamine-phosphate kinase [Dehalococcoidia bacterium]
MKISSLGEFGLIKLLSEIISSEGADRTVEGIPLITIGDDAAAWYCNSPVETASTDTMVQNIHFTLQNTTWRELGWKALSSNLSDIAAMGSTPQYAIVSLSLPGDTDVDSVSQLYHGMAGLAHRFNTAIIGGNISNAPLLVITISLIGSSDGSLLTRSAAQANECIAITGYTGSSAAGLHMIKTQLSLDDETSSLLRSSHNQPYPRISEGQLLLRHGVRAAIDISDGLIQDLAHLCKASGVSAHIFADKIPIHPLVRNAFPSDCLNFALSGGEDYELIFTAPRKVIEDIKKDTGCPINIIGDITDGNPGQVDIINNEGTVITQNSHSGWDHFSPRKL